MGASRTKPERLPEKLRQIRLALDLSQDGMLRQLGVEDMYLRSRISAYEVGRREPPLTVLLEYARSVGVSTDVLIDDKQNLPEWVVKAAKRGDISRSKYSSRRKRKR